MIYNLYGSTEVALATMTTPADTRAAPTTVGRPLLGSRIRILDEIAVRSCPRARPGRIFVGTTSPFEGYTGGGGKEIIDGMLSTGDVGHFDASGRLFIDGRDDEMIISGGENVFPREVEELLVTHEADRRRRGDRSRGRRSSASVSARSSSRATGATLEVEAVQGLREGQPRPLQGHHATCSSSTNFPRNPTGKILKRELAQL